MTKKNLSGARRLKPAGRLDDASELRLIERHSSGTGGEENAIIHGENAQVLSSLEATFAGQVRCVYLDPPYNNGERYTHYHDDLDHAEWLHSLSKRLELIRPLLRPDASVWISIDDSEVHYLKVAADKVFGRHSFVSTIVWQQRTTRENRRAFSPNHEYLLVYSVDQRAFRSSRNLLPATTDFFRRFKNPDNDPRGPWQSVSANVQDGHGTPAQRYVLRAPDGKLHSPPKGRCWAYSAVRMKDAITNNNVWFGRDGNGVPRLKQFLKDSTSGLTPSTLWLGEEVGTTQDAKRHLLRMFPSAEVFDTPKPESLLERIIHIATEPGDLVLDPYLGSGTTAAVAHKMGRRYIGIESGHHAVSHCAERLRMVVNGESGGVSPKADWRGGGGYRFYRWKGLADSSA
jgi:adenine-specific DNA-methyltransferase